MPADLETRADVERLVRAFYGRALEDPIIGFIFTDVAKLDLEAHVPRITSFWETILLGERTYGGGAFAPHARLHMQVGLRRGHFVQWLNLWTRPSTSCSRASARSSPRRTRSGSPARSTAASRRCRRRPTPRRGLTVTQHQPRSAASSGARQDPDATSNAPNSVAKSQ